MRIASVRRFIAFLGAVVVAGYVVFAFWAPVWNFSIALLGNAAFSGVCTLLGLFAIFRFETIQVVLQRLTGIQIGKAKHFIQIILCAAGGTGKTAFIQRVFQHVSNIPPRTRVPRLHVIKLTYRNTLYTIHLFDYDGELPTTLLSKVRWLYVRKQPVDYIFFMVSFYPVPEVSGQTPAAPPAEPEVPATPEGRRAKIKEMVEAHGDLLSAPMLQELFTHTPKLRKIFLLVNQIDLLNPSGGASAEQRAERYFEKIFDRIKTYAFKQYADRVPVVRLLISARQGLEFQDEQPRGFCMIERILEDFSPTAHGEH